MADYYVLPSSPTVLCEDRFSVLDSEDLLVPFWDVLATLLNTASVASPAQLIDLLETIAVIRHGRADTDYGFLKQYLSLYDQRDHFFNKTWPTIRALALEMPILFADYRIPILDRAQSSLTLSRRRVACLVVHQFLCTLSAPEWQEGFQYFHIWYSSEQPHEKAAHAYLAALFEYLSRLAREDEYSPLDHSKEDWPVTYTLHTTPPSPFESTEPIPLTNFKVLALTEATTSPSVLGLPSGAAINSANKFIGFGRTGTQEETHVGSSPEARPTVLITPPLEDDQVLVVEEAEAMISIAGYGRDARLAEILKPDGSRSWKKRTMLFMDALELDLSSIETGLPDLLPGNVDKELKKAYTAFHSHRQSGREAYETIYTGFWGCRTFGGNVGVKTLIQWCAASLAGVELTFICSGEQQCTFGEGMEKFVADARDKASAGEVLTILQELKPSDLVSGDSVLEIVKNRLQDQRE